MYFRITFSLILPITLCILVWLLFLRKRTLFFLLFALAYSVPVFVLFVEVLSASVACIFGVSPYEHVKRAFRDILSRIPQVIMMIALIAEIISHDKSRENSNQRVDRKEKSGY